MVLVFPLFVDLCTEQNNH